MNVTSAPEGNALVELHVHPSNRGSVVIRWREWPSISSGHSQEPEVATRASSSSGTTMTKWKEAYRLLTCNIDVHHIFTHTHTHTHTHTNTRILNSRSKLKTTPSKAKGAYRGQRQSCFNSLHAILMYIIHSHKHTHTHTHTHTQIIRGQGCPLL